MAEELQITSITFRRKCNTGNFESFDIEASAHLGDDVGPRSAALQLQAFVDLLCNERIEALRQPGRRGGVEAPEFEL